MDKWFLSNKKADFSAIGKNFGISPITARIIVNRGLTDEAQIEKYLYGSLKDLHDPLEMKDMDRLAEILKGDIDHRRHIRVVQDYDVDGCMSGYILVRAINECGGIADFDVPDRSEGYGINDRIVDDAIDDGVDTILTCDNGIAAIDVISRARQRGLKVIVTDHHEIQYINEGNDIKYILPDADAVVDPKRKDCPYPFKELCGAGVAYKAAQVLYDIYGISDRLSSLLQFAAIATVCDIVDLTDENRIIVKEGFALLYDTDNYGMRVLLDRCLKAGEPLSVGRVGFFIGPVINAGGRMSTARLVMKLLFSSSRSEAEDILDELIALNNERKCETQTAVDKILSKYTAPPTVNVIVEYDPDCHESVAGIAAGRIKDVFYKPAIVLTDSLDDDGYIKGSARSVEGFDIFRRLMTVRDILVRFGGHPMAAGLTLKRADLKEFIRRVNEPGWPAEAERFRRVTIDAALYFSAITKNTVNELDLIEPCGKGNRKPVFAAKNVKVRKIAVLGKNRNAVKMTLEDPTAEVEGIWFGDGDRLIDDMKAAIGEEKIRRLLLGYEADVHIDILYVPKINYYNGFERIQLDIESFRW